MPRRDDDYEDDDDDREIRSRRRRPPRRYEDDDDDEYDDDEPSAGGQIIPFKNGWALGAYYGSFVSAILVLGALAVGLAVIGEVLEGKTYKVITIGVVVLGILLGPIAAILGVVGMRYAKTHRQAAGGGHALVGLFIGVLSMLIGLLLLIGFAAFAYIK
jgi:hypothetical protein